MLYEVITEIIEAARFNSPLEEFGLVMELRRGLHGRRDARVRTQFPLAIYVPAEECQPWQLGRSTSTFTTHCRMLAEDQESAEKAIELDIKRMYRPCRRPPWCTARSLRRSCPC